MFTLLFRTRGGSLDPERRRGRPSVPLLTSGLLATAALIGCAGDSPDRGGTGDTPAVTGSRPWATSESWWEATLEATTRPDLYLTSVYDVDADSRGRVFLVDWPAGGITVLTPDLAYLQTVGREGEGPGEFIAKEVQILPGDTLLVYDSSLGRITLFDPVNLELLATRPPPNRERDVVSHLWSVPEPGRYFALDRAPYTAGEGEAADQGRTQVILAFDESAETVADTLAIIADSERLVMRGEGYLSVGEHPFGRESFVQALGGNRITHANSGALDITVLDFEGATAHAFSYPTTPIPVTAEELRTASEDMTEPMADMLRSGAPYTWPALVGLVTDDEERIWAGIRAPGESAVWEWAAFGPDGTHAGSILLPAGHLLKDVRDGRIYVLFHDELDVPSIQAYRLEAPAT